MVCIKLLRVFVWLLSVHVGVVALSKDEGVSRELQSETTTTGVFASRNASAGPTPPPTYYGPGTYTLDLRPFAVIVSGSAYEGQELLGLNEYLLNALNEVYRGLYEVNMNYIGASTVQGLGFQVVYNGTVRILNPADLTSRATEEELAEVQAAALSDTSSVEFFWASNPVIGTGLTLHQVTWVEALGDEEPVTITKTKPWVIAVSVAAVVVVLAIIIFFMPRA